MLARIVIPSFLLTLSAGFAPAAAAQEWVSRVKSAPQDYRGRPIVLEGEAVEVRAVSPRSPGGLYRLVDGSDPSGILIRTSDLPGTGGPFRVRARLAPELLSQGSLLLDEIEREATGIGLVSVSAIVAIAGLGVLLVSALLYLRARRDVRHLHLGQPMWLIPPGADAEETLEPGQPPQFNYRLHYVEEERSTRLDRKRRSLLAALSLSALVTIAGVAGVVVLRTADALRPQFILLAPESPRGADDMPERPGARPDDTVRIGLAPVPAPSLAPPPPPARERAPIERRAEPATRPAESAPPVRQAPRTADTVTAQPAPPPADPVPVVLPPPAPPPPAPPPPPPVERDTAPRVDPAALRASAAAAVEAGARRLVQAINQGDQTAVGRVLSGAGEAQRRERFVRFLRDYRPTAELGAAGTPTLSETSAEGGVTIGFRWRAEFGVQRQRDVRFLVTLERDGEGWTFAGARLVEQFP